MKIVFCSSFSGQAGTSSNLAAVTTYLALHSKHRVLMMQTQYEKNYLDDAFLEDKRNAIEIDEIGIDALARMMKSEPMTKEMIDSCVMNLYQNRLFLLQGTCQQNVSMYETMIQPMLAYTVNVMDQYYEMIFVDCGVVNDWKESHILKHADVIVMNLCQNDSLLSHCYGIETGWKEKIFYLIGNYDPISKYNLNYIQKRYRIPSRRIGVIPYNSMFRDAYSDGAVVKFFSQIENSTKDEMNYYFLKELQITSQKLYIFGQKSEGMRRKQIPQKPKVESTAREDRGQGI